MIDLAISFKPIEKNKTSIEIVYIIYSCKLIDISN